MKKKLLEKAIMLFDGTPGSSYIDNYIAKLSKEEITELMRFLKYVKEDINKVYEHDESEIYVENVHKEYICQMSETHMCVFKFHLENESGRSINSETDTDISMNFRSYAKSTWVDHFKITGKGLFEGIDINEYHDWDLLLTFITEKHSKTAKSMEKTNADAIVDKIDEIQMISLDDC